MPKRVSEGEKRVTLNVLVGPRTREAVKRFAGMVGLSQGEVCDDAVALLIQGYADAPLEDGEEYARPESVGAETVERAVGRVPVKIAAEVPKVEVGTVTLEKLPEHLQNGTRIEFVGDKPLARERKFRAPILRPSEKKKW